MTFYWMLSLVWALANSCMLSGTDIGQCVGVSTILDDASFCSEYLSKSVCVPVPRTIWTQYDVRYRNNFIEKLFVQNIEQMLIHEFINRDSVLPFENSISCSQAYKKFLCQMNFPACDQANETTKLCKSVCENFYQTCGKSTAACYLTYAKIEPGFEQC